MIQAIPVRTASARSPWGWVLLGGFCIASLDLVFACSFWGLRHGVAPVRILQSIAAGVLGADSFHGGHVSAALGAVLHYAMAIAFVAVYYLVAARLRWLLRAPVRCGLVYGLVVYAVMNYVVIPLSAVPPSDDAFYPAWTYASIAFHALFVGVPSALFAQRAHRTG